MHAGSAPVRLVAQSRVPRGQQDERALRSGLDTHWCGEVNQATTSSVRGQRGPRGRATWSSETRNLGLLREDHHPRGDQLMANVCGRPGMPRSRGDPSGFGQDVATAIGISRSSAIVGEIVLPRCVPPRRAVQGGVEKLVRRGHAPAKAVRLDSRYLRNLGSMKDAGCLGKRYSADIPRSPVGFRFLPDFPIVEAKAALPGLATRKLCSPLRRS